jgi:hypothetical protein
MTFPVSLFCDECGAANGMQAIMCFACNQPLNLSFIAPNCTWPLAFLAQLTTGIVFLCFASRRIVGLGILIMLALYILDLFVRWIPLGMPGFGIGY